MNFKLISHISQKAGMPHNVALSRLPQVWAKSRKAGLPRNIALSGLSRVWAKSRKAGLPRVLAAVLFVLCLNFSLFAQENIKPNETEIDESAQREFVILLPSSNLNLNPYTNTFSSESQVLIGLHEGLFSVNPQTLASEYALCESFKISRDKKTWTFTLRDATFSNGEKITAQTFRSSWLALLKTPNAPFASFLDCVCGASEYRQGIITDENEVGIIAVNEKTLVVHLLRPTQQLPSILCEPPFSAISTTENVYSGPFILEKNTESEIVLKKNENYWDAKNVHLPSIKFVLSQDYEENTYQFNNGKIDWAIGGVYADRILAKKDISISPQFGTEYFFFKVNNAPWDDAKMRMALLSAIPWEALQKDMIIPALTFIYPLPYYPSIYGVTDYDVDYSKRLIKEAGFEGKDLTVTISIPASDYLDGLVQVLVDSWKEIGVATQIEEIDATTYFSNVQNSSADVFFYNWIGDYADPIAFLELFRSDSALNVSGWKDSTYDNMLNESDFLQDMPRYSKLSEAEQYLLDQAIIIPVSHTFAFNAVSSDIVNGWFENALNIHPLKSIYLNKPKQIPNIVMVTQ